MGGRRHESKGPAYAEGGAARHGGRTRNDRNAVCDSGGMHVGILGGTGPAGRGVAVRMASSGIRVTLGSRDAQRAAGIADDVVARWPGRGLSIDGADNEGAAGADVVVLATPWDSAIPTLRPLRDLLSGRVVISMANALVKEGREMWALLPPRGSVAAAVQAALPDSLVAAAFHHLPASEMEDLDSGLEADVLVCSDHPEATTATVALINDMPGLRPLDAGSLNQAAAIEAFTAVCITLNIRHKVHSTLRMGGI
jgi:NADPH-dependent F420 reductase